MTEEEPNPIDEVINLYQTEDYVGLKEKGIMDPLRLVSIGDATKRIAKEKDPAKRYEGMAEITKNVKQAVAVALTTEYQATPDEETASVLEQVTKQGLEVLEDKLS